MEQYPEEVRKSAGKFYSALFCMWVKKEKKLLCLLFLNE